MAKAKKTKKVSKKKSAQTKSRFYVVRTVQETKENLTQRLEAASEKLIETPLASGKKRVADFKKTPRKAIVELVDDGKEYLTDLNDEVLAKVDDMVKDGKSFLAKAKKNPRKAIAELIDDGKDLVEDLKDDTQDKVSNVADEYKSMLDGLSHDARLLAEMLLDRGQKAFDKVPGKKRVEKELGRRIEALFERYNLPSQKEIDLLESRIKKLNAKVTALSKVKAA